jgi:hypothetical protein
MGKAFSGAGGAAFPGRVAITANRNMESSSRNCSTGKSRHVDAATRERDGYMNDHLVRTDRAVRTDKK